MAWADRIAYVCHDFEDACRAGILSPSDLPEEVAAVVGSDRSRQIGAFVHAVLDAIDRTGHVGMTEPAASALAAFRAFNFDRIYLRPAARRQPGRKGRRSPAGPGRLLRRRARASARQRDDRAGTTTSAPDRSKRRPSQCAT